MPILKRYACRLPLALVLAAGAGVAQVDGKIGALCRFMGELSYPVYIIHYPFIYLFAHWNWSTHPSPLLLKLVVTAVYLGIVILAYALLRWFDRPMRAWLAEKYLDPAVKSESCKDQQCAPGLQP